MPINKGSLASFCILTIHRDGGQPVVFATLMTKMPASGDAGGETSGGTSVSIRGPPVGLLSINVWLPAARSQASSVSEVQSPSVLQLTEPSRFTTLLCSDRNTYFVCLRLHDGEFTATLQVQQHTKPQLLKDVLKCVVSGKLVVWMPEAVKPKIHLINLNILKKSALLDWCEEIG